MATFYGSDTACLTDLQRIDLQVTDPRRLIGERIARRLQTPRGGLASIGDDPDAGFNVRQLVNAKVRPADMGNFEAQIKAECLKDEQVDAAAVNLQLVGDALTIAIELATAEGPFTLTMNVTQLTVEAVFSF